MPINIELTPDHLQLAEAEAQRRQTQNEARGLRGRNRAVSTGPRAMEMHRLGCIGEIAVAVYLGLEEHVFSAHEPIRGSCDLPHGIEVKTRPKHNYDLLVQLDDDPSKLFVLVTHDGTTRIVGWARGRDIMHGKYVRELVKGRPCYVAPQKILQPIETLVEVGLAGIHDQVLGDHYVWTTEDQEGNIVLNFNNDLMAQLGWQAGDILTWDVDPVKCQCIITKAVERNTKSTDVES